jgi:hypothetical protein
VAVLIVLVMATVPVGMAQVNPYVLPSITLSPTSGDVNTQIIISGTGFTPHVALTLSFLGITIGPPLGESPDATGAFTVSDVNLKPANFGISGTFTVTVSGSDIATNPHDTASATFTVINAVAATQTTVTVTSNSVSVDNSAKTGTKVSVTGLTGVTGPVTVATTKESAAPAVTKGAPALPTGTVYVDVHISLPKGVTAPAGATAQVCQTDPSVTSSSTLEYFSNGAWVVATGTTVTGTTICANIPLSALTGTPIAIVPAAAVDYTIYYIGGFVAVLIVVVIAGLFLRRRGGRSS